MADPQGYFVGTQVPAVGLRNVGSYQVSGHPFITGSLLSTTQELQVDFPFVTKEFTVVSSGSTDGGPILRVHFNTSSDGNVMADGASAGGHHFVSVGPGGVSATFDVKCTRVFITCFSGGIEQVANSDNGFELLASLTNIPTSSMYPLTGSGLTT